MIYMEMSHVVLSCTCELSPAPTSVGKIKGGHFLSSPRINVSSLCLERNISGAMTETSGNLQ
jgi:hypothetical protein